MTQFFKLTSIPALEYRGLTIVHPTEMVYRSIDIRRNRQYQAKLTFSFKLTSKFSLVEIIPKIRGYLNQYLGLIFAGASKASVTTSGNNFRFVFELPAARPSEIASCQQAVSLICRIIEKDLTVTGSNEKIINHLTQFLRQGIDSLKEELASLQEEESHIIKKEEAEILINYVQKEVENLAKKNISFDSRMQALQNSLTLEKQKELSKAISRLTTYRSVIKFPNGAGLLQPESVDLAIEMLNRVTSVGSE